MEAKYEELKRQQWEEMIAYMSNYYPSLQTSMRFSSPSLSTSICSLFLKFIKIYN
jgi:hypothetical protein